MQRLSWPNRISLARIVLVAPFVVCLLHLQDPQWATRARWLALIIFAVMAVSDGLDGYLARRLKEESAVGRFLDPLADKLLILCSVVLLANEGTHVTGMKLPYSVAVVAIGKDVLTVAGFCIIYFSTSRVYIEPRRSGKWCTTLLLITVIGILLSPNLPESVRPAVAVAWWSASLLAILTVGQYFQMGRRFLAREATAGRGEGPAE